MFKGINIKEYFESIRPKSSDYLKLMIELANLKVLKNRNADQTIVPNDITLEVGMSHPNIIPLRKRLLELNILENSSISETFDEELLKSVLLFQESSGLVSDGVIGKKTYQALNLSTETKLIQVMVNLERLRWLNFDFGKSYVIINQANYEAKFIKDKNNLFIDSQMVDTSFSMNYAIPDIDYNTLEESQPQRQSSYDDYVRQYAERDKLNLSSVQGEPRFIYKTQSGKLGLSPVPDRSDYEINYEYYKEHTELSASTDEPDLDDRYADLIVSRASYFTYNLRSDPEHAMIAKKEYEEGLDRLRTDLVTKQEYMRDDRVNLRYYGKGVM